MRVELPIATGFYQSNSLPLANQKCINWYPHRPTNPAYSKGALFGCPGIVELATAGVNDVCRGAHVMAGTPYFVLGGSLYSLDRTLTGSTETFSLTNLGTIAGTTRVSMADNGTQLVIQVPGSTGYVYNGTTLAAITDPDFTANGNPQYVVYIDGYFVFSTDSKKFISSALNDGTSYDALDFGTAEADPDDIVAPFVFNNQLMMFGSETYEVFRNIGGTAFPFERLPGAIVDVGLTAPLSLQKISGGFMWLGAGEDEDPAIYLSQGARPQRVSTEPIETAVQNLENKDQVACRSWSYAKDGHFFVGFSFPSRTFVYDTTTGQWHERKSDVNGDLAAYRVEFVVQAYGYTLCGDAYSGKVGRLDNDVYTEYDAAITRDASFQPFVNQNSNFFLPSLEISVESGVGNDDVTDPQLEMRISRDGRTWTDWRARSMGKIGEYNRRCVWRRRGRNPRQAIVNIRVTCKAKSNILRADADIA